MNQELEKPEFFAKDEAPLPMHVLMIREMSMPKLGNRYRESKLARSRKYECHQFYKHISRLLPPLSKEGEENEQG